MNSSEEHELSERDLRKAWIRNLISKVFAIVTFVSRAITRVEISNKET